ncbi:MAG: hypothetical protein AAF228_11725 [Pseudomonadota bacterium]
MAYLKIIKLNYRVIFVCLFTAVIVFSCQIYNNLTIFYDEYQNLTEAKNTGAIRRGWVPMYLPNSSYNIKKIHDLENNELWGKFRFDNLTELDIKCQRIRESDLITSSLGGFTRILGFGIYDFPGGDKFTYYKCKRTQYMALEKNGVGYYWYISEGSVRE